MPLNWTIDSQARRVEIVAEGDVSMAEAMAFFEAIEGAGALPYDKLLDGARGRAQMESEEVMAIVARIRAQHEVSSVGALAVVATREQAQSLARLLGAAAVPDRPLKVFDEIRPAQRWLDVQGRRP